MTQTATAAPEPGTQSQSRNAARMYVCNAWPGPICGTCWATSCECGYVFDVIDDAHSRWHTGRLRCAGCAAP
jgi:hypothetical protein